MNTRRSAFNTLRALAMRRIPARSDEGPPIPWLQDEMGVGIDTESGHMGVGVIEAEEEDDA